MPPRNVCVSPYTSVLRLVLLSSRTDHHGLNNPCTYRLETLHGHSDLYLRTFSTRRKLQEECPVALVSPHGIPADLLDGCVQHFEYYYVQDGDIVGVCPT